MIVEYTKQAQRDLKYWRRAERSVIGKIDELIADIQTHPFAGLGQPEPLKHDLAGFWSRRITREHRLVYRVDAGVLYITACRFHYGRR